MSGAPVACVLAAMTAAVGSLVSSSSLSLSLERHLDPDRLAQVPGHRRVGAVGGQADVRAVRLPLVGVVDVVQAVGVRDARDVGRQGFAHLGPARYIREAGGRAVGFRAGHDAGGQRLAACPVDRDVVPGEGIVAGAVFVEGQAQVAYLQHVPRGLGAVRERQPELSVSGVVIEPPGFQASATGLVGEVAGAHCTGRSVFELDHLDFRRPERCFLCLGCRQSRQAQHRPCGSGCHGPQHQDSPDERSRSPPSGGSRVQFWGTDYHGWSPCNTVFGLTL